MTHKLLLADDSVTIQRVVELTFSGEDVQVVTVGDGEQAIARIPVELPDIVLADIGMPKRSGYEVAAFVKSRPELAHIPVLLLAGAFEPVDEARAKQVQSDGVLVKPFEPQQVISRVRDLIDSSRAGGRQPVAVAHPMSVEEAQVDEPAEHPEPHAPGQPVVAERETKEEPALDDYFDRLDAAFAQLGGVSTRLTPASGMDPDEADRADVLTVDRVLGSSSADAEEAASVHSHPRSNADRQAFEAAGADTRAGVAVADADAPYAGRNLVAEMFAALFAVEQGEAAPPPLQLAAPLAIENGGVSEGLVDEVTRRVLQRLAPDAANDLVAQIVSEVAERLVREEIARIKSAAASRV